MARSTNARSPGGPWSRKDLFDSQCFHLFREVSAEDAVAISKQVTWRAIPRKRFTQLVSSPFGSGMSSDVEVDDTAPIMSQHQKYIQHLETDRWHREEVHRDHALNVVLEEGPPGLRWRLAMAHQILAYAGLANINAKLEQLAVNARCSPQRILATEPTDQFSDVCRNRWPPRLAAAGLPGPEQTKASAVPSDDGVRFYDDQSRPPIAPDSAQPCPKEPIARRQFGALHGALENAKLVSERQVLQLERRSRFEGG